MLQVSALFQFISLWKWWWEVLLQFFSFLRPLYDSAALFKDHNVLNLNVHGGFGNILCSVSMLNPLTHGFRLSISSESASLSLSTMLHTCCSVWLCSVFSLFILGKPLPDLNSFQIAPCLAEVVTASWNLFKRRIYILNKPDHFWERKSGKGKIDTVRRQGEERVLVLTYKWKVLTCCSAAVKSLYWYRVSATSLQKTQEEA